MTRGFITLATGNIKYFKMALNMLKSFRIHNPNAPFAILCDQHNQYTEQFDDVIILEQSYRDYRDKFSLLINSPYDETIFIEPDCLIYRSLDFFWDLLSQESDFSSFGWNDGGIGCWFKDENIKQHLYKIIPEIDSNTDAPVFNPGYLFIRRGPNCNKMYEDCLRIASVISNDHILGKYLPILCNNKLRDDPIFALAMTVNGFICHARPKEGKCIFLPSKYKINKIDILNGLLDVTDKSQKQFTDCALIHFSTRKATEEGLYLWQSVLVDCYYKNIKLTKFLNHPFVGKLFSIYRYILTRFKKYLIHPFKF